ncbi:glycosyl hydrolase 5 (cellulase A) family protein [Abortiporus biennis]
MTLLSVYSILVFLLLGCANVRVQAEQQCRLIAQNALAALDPSSTNAIGLPNGNSTSTHGSSATPTSTGATSAPSATVTSFNYGKDIIRGVNLGGWFVLEPWITPSLFNDTGNDAIIDEFTLGLILDKAEALKLLTNHWQTWITEQDFIDIKAAGLTHVRMQIGYWSIPITSADTNYTTDVDPYIPGAWPYLLQALNWAKQHDIHVILDLHGAPGSQNGYDNSGERGDPTWGMNATDVPRTLDIIKFMSEKIGGMIDVLELINEPVMYRDSQQQLLTQYYQQGYQLVRNTTGQDLQVMIGDAFLGVQSWTNFLTQPSAQGVFMDFHEYQVFNYPQLQLDFNGHINYSCQVLDQLRSYSQSNIFTIIGEWSVATTDCALWLNGRGIGARWDGTWQPNQQVFGNCTGLTGNMSEFSNDYKTFLRKYWEVQADIGEAIQGWVYWAWKVENADDWSYQRGLQGGWIPQGPTSRMYPNQCSG